MQEKRCKFRSPDTMAPCNKYWNAFCWELDAHVGLSKMDETKVFHCHGNHEFSKEVLTRCAPFINIEKSIALFEKNGGYCDCEILFNVEDHCDDCKFRINKKKDDE